MYAEATVETATDADFEGRTAEGRVVVEFSADWCGTCRAMKPVVDRVARDLAGSARVLVVDADANPALVARFGVRALPTFLGFSDGRLTGKLVGAAPRSEIEALLGRRDPAEDP